MRIQTRLLTLISILIVPLVFNLFILGILAVISSRATRDMQTATQQQAASLRIQAQLSNAEAALYRYQIEGEPGFATQFENHLTQFQQEIGIFQSQSTTPQVDVWSEELSLAYQQAKSQGTELIQSRDTQTQDLAMLKDVQLQIESDLQALQSQKPDDITYQEVINALMLDIQEATSATTAYLVSSEDVERIRFTNAVISSTVHLEQLEDLVNLLRDDTENLKALFDQVEALGSRLINIRDQQRTLFAQFAANSFQLGQQTIAGEIQPYSDNYLETTQKQLTQSLSIAVIISWVVSLTAGIWAVMWAFLNVRFITQSIQVLVHAADRIALGNYHEPVQLDRQDELQYLGQAFNTMMQQLAERQQRLNNLLQKLAIVQEEERRLVGLDLHDGLTQTLLSANMHLSTLAALASNLDTQSQTELKLCQTRLQDSIAEVRWVISELRPNELEDFGLVEGLRQYITKVAQHVGWRTAFSAEVGTAMLSATMETAIFRIVQEALSNARKYANTDRIQVKLHHLDRRVKVEIQDWGSGFDINKLGESETLGLLGMKERAELFNGELVIQSMIGGGTTIMVSLPLYQ